MPCGIKIGNLIVFVYCLYLRILLIDLKFSLLKWFFLDSASRHWMSQFALNFSAWVCAFVGWSILNDLRRHLAAIIDDISSGSASDSNPHRDGQEILVISCHHLAKRFLQSVSVNFLEWIFKDMKVAWFCFLCKKVFLFLKR